MMNQSESKFQSVRLWLFVLSVVFCFLWAGLCRADQLDSDSSTTHLIQYLLQEKNNLHTTVQQAQKILQPETHDQLKALQQQNLVLLALIQGKILSFDHFLINQRLYEKNLANRLKKLQQLPPGQPNETSIQEEISRINHLNAMNKQAIQLIIDNQSLARRHQTMLLSEQKQLSIWQEAFKTDQKIEVIDNQIAQLEKKRAKRYEETLLDQASTNDDKAFSQTLYKESALLLNNQWIILLQYQIAMLELDKKIIRSDYQLNKNQDLKTMQSTQETYINTIHDLNLMNTSMLKMQEVIKKQRDLINNADLKRQFQQLNGKISEHIKQINRRVSQLNQTLTLKEQQLKTQLSLRQSLVEYHLTTWPAILHQLLMIPTKSFNYVKGLAYKVHENYTWQAFWPAVLFWIMVISVLCAAISLNWFLRLFTKQKERSRLSAHLYDALLVLLYRNLPHLTLLGILLITFTFNDVPFNHYQVIVDLILIWLIFRNIILISRLVFLESMYDVSGYDAKLYYRLRALLLLGGWSAALMMLSHQLPLSLLLQDIFNRLFMFFLLSLALVMWKNRHIIPQLIRPLLKVRKRYFRHVISIFIVVVPLILFTTAIIGLVGYTSLAWTMSRYQANLLLLLAGYVLIRGLLFDVVELLSEWMVVELHNGWLWIEVVLKPIDKIMRVLLFVATIIIFLKSMGWFYDEHLRQRFHDLMIYPYIDVSGIYITLLSTFKFFILVCVFIWAAKWTREFCYRWLYRNVKDAGIRNSFSVFTQYAIVLIGAFITLRVLGFDFSGMAMILGGLAVGMGFGLRDFASNIVGGLMLLIERPVREGDLISIGEYEGRVAHIGLRSMRVSSWDNMEVWIPNAETFNKPFTNWTHQDSIVRTVVPVRVTRADDPLAVQRLIYDVLFIIPEILKDPAPQVFMKQIDEALIEFEVRYFINVQLHTRFEIRSKVLFAITAQFKAAGIHAPITPYQIEVKEPKSKADDTSATNISED